MEYLQLDIDYSFNLFEFYFYVVVIWQQVTQKKIPRSFPVNWKNGNLADIIQLIQVGCWYEKGSLHVIYLSTLTISVLSELILSEKII